MYRPFLTAPIEAVVIHKEIISLVDHDVDRANSVPILPYQQPAQEIPFDADRLETHSRVGIPTKSRPSGSPESVQRHT